MHGKESSLFEDVWGLNLQRMCCPGTSVRMQADAVCISPRPSLVRKTRRGYFDSPRVDSPRNITPQLIEISILEPYFLDAPKKIVRRVPKLKLQQSLNGSVSNVNLPVNWSEQSALDFWTDNHPKSESMEANQNQTATQIHTQDHSEHFANAYCILLDEPAISSEPSSFPTHDSRPAATPRSEAGQSEAGGDFAHHTGPDGDVAVHADVVLHDLAPGGTVHVQRPVSETVAREIYSYWTGVSSPKASPKISAPE